MGGLMSYRSVAEDIYAHAVAHYNDGGWDVIVECYGVEGLVQFLLKTPLPRSDRECWELVESLVDIWADRQADAVNSAF
jgi:hypothetical protein